jgi:putative tricarboxylic transport membrane protein
MLEANVMRALRISGNDPWTFFSSPVANILWALLVISLFIPTFVQWRQNRRARTDAVAGASFGD